MAETRPDRDQVGCLAPPARLERATCGLEVRCSIQLSYGGRTREPDGVGFRGAGDGDRTRIASLEGWNSAIELHPRATGTIPGIRRQSGWPDSNRRPLAPKASALPSCATARGGKATAVAVHQCMTFDCCPHTGESASVSSPDRYPPQPDILPGGSLAQLAEQGPLKPKVPGSSPGRPTRSPRLSGVSSMHGLETLPYHAQASQRGHPRRGPLAPERTTPPSRTAEPEGEPGTATHRRGVR